MLTAVILAPELGTQFSSPVRLCFVRTWALENPPTDAAWVVTGPDGTVYKGQGVEFVRLYPAPGEYHVAATLYRGSESASAEATFELSPALYCRRSGLIKAGRFEDQAEVERLAGSDEWRHRHGVYAGPPAIQPGLEGWIGMPIEHAEAERRGFRAALKARPAPNTGHGFVLPNGTRIFAGQVGSDWVEWITNARETLHHRVYQGARPIKHRLRIEMHIDRIHGRRLQVHFQHGSPSRANVVHVAYDLSSPVAVHPHRLGDGKFYAAAFALTEDASLDGGVGELFIGRGGPITVHGLIPAVGQPGEWAPALKLHARVAWSDGSRSPQTSTTAGEYMSTEDPLRQVIEPAAGDLLLPDSLAVVSNESGVELARLEVPTWQPVDDNDPPCTPVLHVVGTGRGTVTLRTDDYWDIDEDHHHATQWQFASSPFGWIEDIVADTGWSFDGTQRHQAGLPVGSVLYARCRFQDARGAVSHWSNVVEFETLPNHAPYAPELVLYNVEPTLADFGLGHFVDPDGDPHMGSELVVALASDPDFLQPVYASGWLAGAVYNFRAWPLPERTDLIARARVRDDYGAASDWSNVVSFTTGSSNRAPNKPVLSVGALGDTWAVIVGAAFTDPDGDEHLETQWQTIPAGGSFASPLFDDIFGGGGRTLMTVMGLTELTSYLTRARFRDARGAWSEWSDPIAYTTQRTNHPPQKPTLTVDQITGTGCRLTAGPFVDQPGDWHQASQWQVSSTASFAAPAVDVTSTTSLLQHVASGALAPATDQWARGRFRDQHGAWSDWSDAVPFRTLAPDVYDQPEVIAVYDVLRGLSLVNGQIQSWACALGKGPTLEAATPAERPDFIPGRGAAFSAGRVLRAISSYVSDMMPNGYVRVMIVARQRGTGAADYIKFSTGAPVLRFGTLSGTPRLHFTGWTSAWTNDIKGTEAAPWLATARTHNGSGALVARRTAGWPPEGSANMQSGSPFDRFEIGGGPVDLHQIVVIAATSSAPPSWRDAWAEDCFAKYGAQPLV